MNWQDILAIVIPILSLMGWTYNRIDKKFENMQKNFESVLSELKEVRKDIQSLDRRVSHLEGFMYGRDPRFPELKIIDKKEEK